MKKIFSFMLMATALLISTSMWAAKGQGHDSQQEGDVAKVSVDVAGVITTIYYATLQEAFDDLPTNSYPATIELLNNVDIQFEKGAYVSVAKYQNVTLDLKGFAIYTTETASQNACIISNQGTLTIVDNSENHTGIVENKALDASEASSPTYANNIINNSGTLILKSGKIKNYSSDPDAAAVYAIDMITSGSDAVFIMEGGSVEQPASDCIRLRANSKTYTTSAIIKGGTLVSGGACIWIQGFSTTKGEIQKANVEILGGTLISTCKPANIWGYMWPYGGPNVVQTSSASSREGFDIHISNGDLYGCISTGYVGSTARNNNYGALGLENIVIEGGNFYTSIIDDVTYTNSGLQNTAGLAMWKGPVEEFTGFITGGVFPATPAEPNEDAGYFVYDFTQSDKKLTHKGWENYIAEGYTKEFDHHDEEYNIDYYRVVPCVGETTRKDGNWNDVSIWENNDEIQGDIVPTNATDVVITSKVIVPENIEATAHQVNVNEGQIIVKKGAVLEIGAGGIKTNNKTLQPIIVEAGGTLRVGVGGVSKEAGTLNPVEIYNDGSNSGAFMINPNAQVNTMPEATIHLTTNVRKDRWQHLALPIEDLTEHSNDKGAANAVFEWKNNDWNKLEIGWSEIEAFKGYDFTNNYEGEGKVTYTFKGQLIGIQNQGLSLIEGVNFFGNSYTAPISLSALFDQIGSDMAANTIEKTVYIYNSANLNYGFTSSLGIELAEMGYADLDFKTIAPLQGFWMNLQEGKGTAGTTLNYAKAVWNNTEELGKPQFAPSRKSSGNNFSTVATINVTAANGAADKVMLVEGEDFSSEFENGSDASKMMSEESFNLFAATENGNQSMVATDNLEGTILSFQAADAINYTLNFSHIHGNEYAIRDLKTGAIIPMVENGTYNFVAQPNSIEDRFEVVIRGISTNNEVVVAAPAVKGIYTAMGQYLGETAMWNNLPAGMYIVDGVRMVK